MDDRQIHMEASRQLQEEEEKKKLKLYEQKPQIIEQGEITEEKTNFVFFSNKVIFEESRSSSTKALISGTFMMLNEPSYKGNQYDFDEFENFEETFEGIPVYYGTRWIDNLHDLSKPSVGFVMGARKLGKRVYGVCAITNRKIISALKKGKKFLFSIMGFSESFERVKIKNRIVKKLKNITVTSLQLLPLGTNIGFNQARMDKLLSVQETVGFFGNEIVNIGVSEVIHSEEFNKQLLQVAGIIE